MSKSGKAFTIETITNFVTNIPSEALYFLTLYPSYTNEQHFVILSLCCLIYHFFFSIVFAVFVVNATQARA